MEVLTASGRFETRSANPALPWGTSAPAANSQLGMGVAGVSVSETTALQLAAVWGSVAIISDSIATLPIRQWKLGGDGEPVAMDSAPVVNRPWPEYTQRDFITQGTVSQLLRGNIFGQVTDWDQYVRPAQVRMIPPQNVSIRRNSQTGQLEVRYYNVLQDPDNVTRAMGLSLPGGVIGLNPIEYFRNAMGIARAQDLYEGAFYSNSAQPGGAIKVPGDLDPNETKALGLSWLEAHQGINKSHLPAVLTGGAEWQSISMSMVDAQFLEMMQYSASVISGMFYRVPPHMLGMVDKDTSWGAGIEQQELGFVRNTLLIWLARWEDLLTSWLPPRQFVTFDLSGRLRGDTLQRFQAHQIGRICGFMNNLDILRAENMPIPTDPATLAILSDYQAPLNSSPLKVSGPQGPAGDKANSLEGLPEKRQDISLAPVFNVQLPALPDVHVNTPALRLEPRIDVAAPVVNVTTPEVRFEPVVNVAAAPVPDVHVDVAPPTVNVAAPVVNIPEQPAPTVIVNRRERPPVPPAPKRVRKTVERDEKTGRITAVNEEELPDA